MKVLGINGSPRIGGNTDILLDAFLDGARSAGAGVEKIQIDKLNIKPCREGGCCYTGRDCTIDDGMKLVYDKIKEADGIAIASPVFFGSITAQLKTMIDRFQPFWVKKYILKHKFSGKRKRGAFLCVGAYKKRKFFLNSRSIARIFFLTLDAQYLGDIYVGGVDKKGDINGKEEYLKKAYALGRKLAGSLK